MLTTTTTARFTLFCNSKNINSNTLGNNEVNRYKNSQNSIREQKNKVYKTELFIY